MKSRLTPTIMRIDAFFVSSKKEPIREQSGDYCPDLLYLRKALHCGARLLTYPSITYYHVTARPAWAKYLNAQVILVDDVSRVLNNLSAEGDRTDTVMEPHSRGK